VEEAHRRLWPSCLLSRSRASTVGAHAEEQSGAETIHYGQALFVEIEHYDGGVLNVMYDVEVAYGPTVWVYFVPREGYYEYVDKTTDTFTYYIDWSDLGTSHTEMVVQARGVRHLLPDHRELGPLQAGRDRHVRRHLRARQRLDGRPVLAILLFPITVVVLVVALYVRRQVGAGAPPVDALRAGRMPEDNDPVPPQEERRRYPRHLGRQLPRPRRRLGPLLLVRPARGLGLAV